MTSLDETCQIEIVNDRCKVLRKGSDNTFEILSPPLHVSFSRIGKTGTLGSRYAKNIEQAEYVITLECNKAVDASFSNRLKAIQELAIRTWWASESSFPSSKSSFTTIDDILLKAIPVITSTNTIRIKRKVCEFGRTYSPLPIYTKKKEQNSFYKSNFRTCNSVNVKKGDLVRVVLTCHPYSILNETKIGMSLRLHSIFKVKNDETASCRRDWSSWSV